MRDANNIVSHVHFIAETVLEGGGNHWTMFLLIGSNQAVRINMHPSDLMRAQISGHGYRGAMNISHSDDAITENRQAVLTIPATLGHTAAEFIDAIIHAGNHKYDFTTTGRGCTGWMLDQYRLFLGLHFIQLENNDLEDAVNWEWIYRRRTDKRVAATVGFYMRHTRGGGWSAIGKGKSTL